MKNILFYDTETSGLYDFKSAPDAPHQPRIVQLAIIVTDPSGKEIALVKTLIRPDGWQIKPEATAVNGITTEYAQEHGIPIFDAISMFEALASTCVGYVCHNADFDSQIKTGEQIRLQRQPDPKPHFCTMKAMTHVCRLPGRNGYKWPKLQEAYRHCFEREFEGAHDALSDVRACKEIYFWLKNRK